MFDSIQIFEKKIQKIYMDFGKRFHLKQKNNRLTNHLLDDYYFFHYFVN